MAQSKNIPATILCSTPFLFEGIKKIERAHNFLGELLNKQFNIVSINAPDMCKANPNISFENCFYYLDNIMREKLKDIVNLIK